jgi:hypothetical protein
MIGGTALFAIKFCPPSQTSQLIKNYDLRNLVNISNDYYLADPIIFDKNLHDKFIDENPVFMLLRLVSSQFTFELQKFHYCSIFKPIIVSLEPLFLINSEFFREYINTLLAAEGVTGLDWQILSIDELEALQPHIAAGFNLAQVLDELRNKSFNNVLENLSSQTNRTFAHSFLYDKQEELYQRLGVPEEGRPGNRKGDNKHY